MNAHLLNGVQADWQSTCAFCIFSTNYKLFFIAMPECAAPDGAKSTNKVVSKFLDESRKN